MSKFCGNCGTMVSEDARVCGNCGHPIVNPSMPNPGMSGYESPVGGYGAPTPPNQSGSKFLLPIVAAFVAIIIFVVGINIVNNFTGTNGMIRRFAKCMETGKNGAKIEEYIPDYLKEAEGYDLLEIEEMLEKSFIDANEDLEDRFGDYSISYKKIGTEKMNKEDLEDYREIVEYINEEYDTTRIKAVKNVEIKFIIKGDKRKESENVEFIFIKEGTKWKMDIQSMNLF